jgi:hypothetical protein
MQLTTVTVRKLLIPSNGSTFQIGPWPPPLRFLKHTHNSTHGRTPLDEWNFPLQRYIMAPQCSHHLLLIYDIRISGISLKLPTNSSGIYPEEILSCSVKTTEYSPCHSTALYMETSSNLSILSQYLLVS